MDGELLVQLRKSRGLSREQLGSIVGVSGAAIYKYENNMSNPRLRVLEALSQYFEVPIGSLAKSTTNSFPDMDSYKLEAFKLIDAFEKQPDHYPKAGDYRSLLIRLGNLVKILEQTDCQNDSDALNMLFAGLHHILNGFEHAIDEKCLGSSWDSTLEEFNGDIYKAYASFTSSYLTIHKEKKTL